MSSAGHAQHGCLRYASEFSWKRPANHLAAPNPKIRGQRKGERREPAHEQYGHEPDWQSAARQEGEGQRRCDSKIYLAVEIRPETCRAMRRPRELAISDVGHAGGGKRQG